MRIAVCDDERYFRDLITEKINKIYKDDIDMVIRIFEDGFDFLKNYYENTDIYGNRSWDIFRIHCRGIFS